MNTEDAAQKLLRAVLTDESHLLPFGTAVLRQLGSSTAGVLTQDDPIAVVVELLRALQEDDAPPSAKRLARSPAVLASFFQNADLVPLGTPESARLGALVLAAMEIASVDGQVS